MQIYYRTLVLQQFEQKILTKNRDSPGRVFSSASERARRKIFVVVVRVSLYI